MSEDLDDFLIRPDLSSAGRGGSRRLPNRRFRSDCRRNCRCSRLGSSTGPPQRLQAPGQPRPATERLGAPLDRPRGLRGPQKALREAPRRHRGTRKNQRTRCTVDEFQHAGQTRARCRQERSNSRSGGAETCPGAAQEPSESVQGGGQGHPGRPRSGPRGAGSGQKLARKRPDRPRTAQEPPRPAQEPDTTASGALTEAAGGLPGLCFGALSGTWLLDEMSGEY